jgi:hypothetical protein
MGWDMQTGRTICTSTAAGLAGGLALLAAVVAQAQPPARAVAAAALPDWRGVWAPMQPDILDAKAGSKATRDHAPYTAEYEAKYKASMAALKADKSADPLSLCSPTGMPRMMTLAGRYEFIVTPDKVFVLADTAHGAKSTGNQARRIYTDGRAALAGDDIFPTYTGNENGKWEGSTLVVHTTGLNDGNFVDRTGALLSGDHVIDERIRMSGPNTMEDRITVTDPKALTRPWTVIRTWRRMPAGTEIVDDSCSGKKVNPAAMTDAAVARAKARGK